jgi:hypothetical protein
MAGGKGEDVPEYTRQMGNDFWFDFDNATLWHRTPEIAGAIQRAYANVGGLDALADIFDASFATKDHPSLFVKAITPGKDGFVDLAKAQQKIITAHFGNDGELLQSAFQDFGQGILYDPRRAKLTQHIIHMMDGTPDTWVGYRRWHAFCRAAMLSGADQGFWLQLLRLIAVAWGIQTEADPVIDKPDNPSLDPKRLKVLSDFWLSADLNLLDRAFVQFKHRAPSPEHLQRITSSILSVELVLPIKRFAHVQDILNNAATDGDPIHGDNGKFWNKPLKEFMAIGSIYGVHLIADAGPNRGARSGLIKALRGESPFGDGGIPRMPMDRPPVSAEDISFIERWIDDGCPDDTLDSDAVMALKTSE